MRKAFYVEMDSLREIENALGMARDKSKMVLKTAINNVAKQTEKGMVEGTDKKYQFGGKGKSAIRKANKVKKAKTSALEATVTANGGTNDLLDFHVLPRKYYPGGKGVPKWVKANVLRGTAAKKLSFYNNSVGDPHKAFVVRYKSGHMAVAERVPGEMMRGNPRKQAIRSLYAIATPKAEETVYREELEGDMYDLLQKSIQEQIQRFVK